MKKLFLFILLLPVCLVGRAQGWYIGAEASRGVASHPYWQAAVTGSYTMKVASFLSLDANASLYYQHHDQATVFFDFYNSNIENVDINAQTFGGALGLNAILPICKPVSFFTGPQVMCNFFQKNYFGGYAIDYTDHRALGLWRIGLQAQIWRLRVRASWDILMTDRSENGRKGSAISIGVAYRL